MKILSLLSVLLLSISLYAQQGDSTLNIKIENIKDNKGNIMIGLYNNSKNFPKGKPYKKVFVSPNKSIYYSFHHLAKGVYALAILHDKNKNQKMDIGIFGPKEPYGFSNNAKGFFSPPSFEKASFVIDGKTDKNLRIKLK